MMLVDGGNTDRSLMKGRSVVFVNPLEAGKTSGHDPYVARVLTLHRLSLT